MRINTLLISALLCLPLTSAYANNYSNKVYAKNIGMQNGPEPISKVCFYETRNKYQFSVLLRNTVTCPHIVFYNMNTGNVTTS
ncbi:Uncharacterised protein [Yersinia kristensenii]|nr:Uncharacterised protein [Yersinia kristensenii]CNM00633.1 Uncharacterised protein [Yersinia intermedia]CQJ01719.1 Uncharacterised protein [Yersinia frederiksenii]CQJ15569.1 Uncharacterised protein [Yersinia enterocolitica]CQQ72098.1 Uncharacterised protein [Yersinia enterocolitica]